MDELVHGWLKESWAKRWGLLEHPHRDGIKILMRAHDYIWFERHMPIDERIAACNLLYELAEELIWE